MFTQRRFVMFEVKIVEGYMDPSYCNPRHSGTFRGVGRSRSPKTAMRLAREALALDYRKDLDLASSCPIYDFMEIRKNGKVIWQKYD